MVVYIDNSRIVIMMYTLGINVVQMYMPMKHKPGTESTDKPAKHLESAMTWIRTIPDLEG